MAERVMFIQLKTGYDIDQGPTWISSVRFNKTCNTAYWHGRRLHRRPGMFDANFNDVETGEKFWVSGPHRDGRDVRYSGVQPTVDDDIRETYEAFRGGAPLSGREKG